MSKSDATENAFLKLVYQAVAWANVADNAASSPFTHIDYSLNTADPGESGTAATSEITYTSYARAVKSRNATDHTVTANSMSPASSITFPAGTGGSGTAAYFTTSFASNSTPTSTTNAIIHSGTVTPNIVCGSGVTPSLTTSTAITED